MSKLQSHSVLERDSIPWCRAESEEAQVSQRTFWRANIRLFYLDALRREPERVEASVSDDAEVGGRGDGDARVIVRRVLDRVGIEPLGAKL